MKNKNNQKILLLVAAVLTVFTVLLLLIFRADTAPMFTASNVSLNLFVKALVASLLVFAVTTAYFFFRFKKKGVYLGIYSAVSALISCVVAFDLCALCRAPMGNLTFAVMLFCVVITYTTSVMFANSLSVNKSKKKKNDAEKSSYDKAAEITRKAMTVVFPVAIIAIAAAAILSFVFSAFSLALCAAPAILSAGYSFLLALNFGARLYAEKI